MKSLKAMMLVWIAFPVLGKYTMQKIGVMMECGYYLSRLSFQIIPFC